MPRVKRSFFPVLMIICMAFILTFGNGGCTQKGISDPQEEFHELVQEIQKKNETIHMPSAISKEYIPPALDDTAFSKEDYELWEQACEREREEPYITKDDAQKELYWVKRLFRKFYGNYYRFGGDQKFDAAVENVLAGFEDKDRMESPEYQSLLGEQFAFVKDSHFSIGYAGAMQEARKLLADETNFFRKDGKFYLDQKCRQEVMEIEGKSPDTYIKRAIGMDGSLTWYPYVLGELGEESRELKVRYQEGLLFKKEKEKVIELSSAEYLGQGMPEKEDVYAYEERAGLPYIKLNAFASKNKESAVQFVQSAAKLKEAPGAVIDLTQNSGGAMSTLDAWFEAYTGSQWYPHGALLSREHEALENDEDSRFEGESERDLYARIGMKEKEGYGIFIPEKRPLIANGQRLFLLISRSSASCAEMMTDACRGMEGTVIIGTNTGGHLTGDIMKMLKLPLSGAWLGIGTAMFCWDEAYFQEGAGFEPDIYLTGKNCEKRLDKFLEKYE